MRRRWTTREIAAPASAVWDLLVDPDRWPAWGPSVRAVELDAPSLAKGTRGRVQTAIGVWVPFEITAYDESRAWSWEVVGVPATDHRVDVIDERRCRAGFGVPWIATPYLAVCAIALGRLDRLACD